MDITINERLKKLRQAKENTQEDLAEYIGISFQAISKWERGEAFPDITLLPKIAAYYNVSVDDLLGVDKIRRKEKIARYCDRAKTENGLAVWREAIGEFPNDLEVISHYMYALPDDNEQEAREKIKMAERLINESTDQENYTFGALQNLCYTHKKLGEVETAKKYAEQLPHYMVTWSQIMMSLLKGEEAVKHIQYNLMQLTDLIWLNILNLAREGEYKPNERIYMYEYSLKLFDLLFEGDYGFYYDRTCDLYGKIAKSYAELQDLENTVKNLELSAEHIAGWITLRAGGQKALLVKGRPIDAQGGPGQSEWLLEYMQEELFDFCRDDKRFKAIAQKLQENLK